jgi:hypothetical protein
VRAARLSHTIMGTRLQRTTGMERNVMVASMTHRRLHDSLAEELGENRKR